MNEEDADRKLYPVLAVCVCACARACAQEGQGLPASDSGAQGAARSLQPCPAPAVMHTQTSGGPLPGCGGLPRTGGVGGLPESPSAQTPRHHSCFRIRSLPLNTLLCAALCAIKRSAAFLMVTWPLLHECRTDDLIMFFLQIVLVSNFLLL